VWYLLALKQVYGLHRRENYSEKISLPRSAKKLPAENNGKITTAMRLLKIE